MAWPKGKPRKAPATAEDPPVAPSRPLAARRAGSMIGGWMPPAPVVTVVDPGPMLGYRARQKPTRAQFKPNPV